MQLNLSLLYKVQLFCMVPFLVENITLKQLHWLEVGHQHEQKVLLFILQKIDLVDDLTVGNLDDLGG